MSGRPGRPLVIAHRGASAYRPENTLPAYELAVSQRADMIEIDLHRTRDGACVITHDETLGHLGGAGAIEDAGVAEVRALDAGEGERVPLLDEVLDAFGERVPFNLELKRGVRGLYAGLEAQALAAVERRGLLGATLFSSFFDPALAELRRLAPEARVALLIQPRTRDDALARALELGAEALNPWFALATPELVAAAHDAGLAVYPYTVDDPDDMCRLLDAGVDGLFTNRPDRMRRVLGLPEGEGRE